jgi:hypothetical protein
MSVISETLNRSTRQMIAKAALAGMLVLPVCGHIGPPVQLSLASSDSPRIGEPSVIYVILHGGADVAHAEFQMAAPAGWQIIKGQQYWAGSIKTGQKIEFQMLAVPMSGEPGALEASVRVPQFPPYIASLHPNRMGERFPEKGVEQVNSKDRSRGAAVEEEMIEPRFEPGEVLPEPANATEPRLPGQLEPKAPYRDSPVQTSKDGRAAVATITATGRFTYLDDNNVRRGVRNATVELFNESRFPFFDERCARGITDSSGNFTLQATCGDLNDGPDIFLRIVLNNSVVEVKPDSATAGSYTFRTATRQNSLPGIINFGTLTVTTNQPAFQAHNLIMRARQFMATLNEPMAKVTVRWPGNGTFYQNAFDSITLETDRPFGDEGVVFHEYGHHILSTKAESPSPNYDNGICDTPDPGHCLFSPENGIVSWTEGWPNFFAAFVHDQFNGFDGYGQTMMEFETRPVPFTFLGEEDKIEGVIAGILWDLTDNINDDQALQGPGRRDRMQLPFSAIWDVITNFDPSTSSSHNHPTSIHELWDGLRQLQFNEIDRISEVYREHGIIKPQPDLRMTQLVRSATSAPGTLTLINTVRNEGNESALREFTIRVQVLSALSNALIGESVRTVPAGLVAGSSSTASTVVTLPPTNIVGLFRFRACADSGGTIPESDEADNCITIDPVVASLQ